MKSLNLIVLALVAIYLLAAPLAFGQGGNPPAGTKESGKTSGHGMISSGQTYKGNAEEQIKKLTDQVIAAQLKADTNSHEKLLADDYTAIRGDGTLSTNPQDIESFRHKVKGHRH